MLNPVLSEVLDRWDRRRREIPEFGNLKVNAPVPVPSARKGTKYNMQGSSITGVLRDLPVEDAVHLKIEGECIKDGELILTSVHFETARLTSQMSMEHRPTPTFELTYGGKVFTMQGR